MANEHSRRSVLKLGGGLVSMAALGGCTSVLSDDGGSSGDLDAVPAGMVFVSRIDVQRVLDDDEYREAINEMMKEQGSSMVFQPSSVEELLNKYEDKVGIDPRAASSVLYFVDADDNAGAIIEGEWSKSDMKSAIEQSKSEMTTSTYNGKDIYKTPDNSDVGVLSDGKYVLASLEIVKTCIDIEAGDSESVSGTLVDGYEAAPDGYMQFAFTLPEDFEPNDVPDIADRSAVMAMKYGAGAMYRGDTRGAEIELAFESADAATSMKDTFLGGKQILASQMSDMQMPDSVDADPQKMIQSTEIERDGSTVMIENTTEDGILEVMLTAVVSSFFLGLGASSSTTGGTAVQPNVSFQVEFSSDGELTITHAAGDAVRASELYIDGNGLGQTGSWDQISDSTGPNDRVSAGDSITIEAQSDYEVIVMWISEESESSATLMESEGPDA